MILNNETVTEQKLTSTKPAPSRVENGLRRMRFYAREINAVSKYILDMFLPMNSTWFVAYKRYTIEQKQRIFLLLGTTQKSERSGSKKFLIVFIKKIESC